MVEDKAKVEAMIRLLIRLLGEGPVDWCRSVVDVSKGVLFALMGGYGGGGSMRRSLFKNTDNLRTVVAELPLLVTMLRRGSAEDVRARAARTLGRLVAINDTIRTAIYEVAAVVLPLLVDMLCGGACVGEHDDDKDR
jgi:hypothetical protein